jgi:quinoprotein glucose dehydrogenase
MIEKDGAVGSAIYEPLRADKPIVRFPGSAGGPEWGGGAFDPTLGLYIFNSNQLGNIEKLVRPTPTRWRGQPTLPRSRDPHALPEAALGRIDRRQRQYRRGCLALGPWRHRLSQGQAGDGSPSNAGPIITAGGVTFVGGTDDHRFRAFETRTGRELWTVVLDYSAHATPMTYQGEDGRQYVAIVATGGSYWAARAAATACWPSRCRNNRLLPG